MLSTDSSKAFLVYVDDDPDDLYFIQEAFSSYRERLSVITFEKSPDAYQFLLELERTSKRPGLIILDMNMPALSGREMLQLLRAIPFFDETPIILFTTSNSSLDEQFAHSYKAGFVTKPMSASQMHAVADQFWLHCHQDVRESIRR